MNWIINSYPEKTVSIGNKSVTKGTKFKYDDNNIAILKYKNGIVGKVTSNFSCTMPHHHTLKIFGSKGTIDVNLNKIYLYKSKKKNSKPKIIKFKRSKVYKQKVLKSFIKSIKNNKKSFEPSLKEIYSSLATCFAIDKSKKTKKWELIK